MTVVEFILVALTLWTALLLVDFSQSHRQGPALFQSLGARLFRSFGPSVAIHLGLFCAVYGATTYLVIQAATMYDVELAVLWAAGGAAAAVPLVEGLRIRTDDTWLLRRWIADDLARAVDPQAHLDALVATIRETPGKDSSLKALTVLRSLSRRGDSTGGLVYRTLEREGLL